MTPLTRIRQEIDEDQATIYAVTEEAFRGMPYAGGDEQEVIDRLRDKGALTLSLVAIVDKQIVGHIAFSPAKAADGSKPWFALGPVSVIPELQRKGVGSQLILKGLEEIEQLGALGCVLTGNPVYYRKFGFELAPDNAPSNEERDYFMIRCLKAQAPEGRIVFDSGFYGD